MCRKKTVKNAVEQALLEDSLRLCREKYRMKIRQDLEDRRGFHNVKLYELSQSYLDLIEYAESEDADPEVMRDTLEAIEDSIEDKFENISKLIKTIEGNIELFKSEEKRISQKRKAMENKVSWLKSYMLGSLETTGMKSVEAGTFRVARQKNPPKVNIVDKGKLPKEYLIIPPTPEPKEDKRMILEALRNELKVEGAEIAPDSYHIRIR